MAEIKRWAALGAAVDAPDGNGATPMVVAAAIGQIEAIKALAELGASVDAPDADRQTPPDLLFQVTHWDRYEDAFLESIKTGASLDSARPKP